MLYDVVLVLYNSSRWISSCLHALSSACYDLSLLHLIVVDNASADDSFFQCEKALNGNRASFGKVTFIKNSRNKGFGAACNQGVSAGDSPRLFFLNVDTEVDVDVFSEIDKGIERHPEAGGFECRQLPYEMGHHIDPVSLETPWASGAALVVMRAVFEEAGRFDEQLFLYCEDVELSWRIRGTGHPIFYLPNAVVNHYVLDRNKEGELREYAFTFYSFLLLSYKYGHFRDIVSANVRFLKELFHPQHFDGVRRVFAKNYMRHWASLWPFLFWRMGHRSLYKQTPAVFVLPPAPERGRALLAQRIEEGPLISVVVRTHARPQVLRGALQSIANQTYRRFEVVVVEDGADSSRAMVEKEFSFLPLRYFSTGENVGRGKAGNFGLQQAKGEYLNFLDDDDYFYPDHLELMADKAISFPDAELILGCAMAMKVEVTDPVSYRYKVKNLHTMLFDRLDLFTMSQTCQIPIQSAIFKKSLLERHGGLREDINAHEDWWMWMRFLSDAKRINTKHVDIHRATSVFVLPAGQQQQTERLEEYKKYNEMFFTDPSMQFTVSLADMRGFYDDMLADVEHLRNIGKLDDFLEQQKKERQ